MASFATHIGVGLSLSGVAATSVYVAGLATPREMLVYLGLGTIGSLLPDVDADNSTPVHVGFTLVSITLAFVAMFSLTGRGLSVAELVILWLLTYGVFRWLVFALFIRLSVHRGMFHSVPAAALMGLLTAIAAHRLLGQPPLQAWIGGCFVSFGYLVHLTLDEIYSVNLFGLRVRRSLGTALKFWSSANPLAGLCLYAACVTAAWMAPDPQPFLRVVSARETFIHIGKRLLPEQGWFRRLTTDSPETLRPPARLHAP